MPAASSAPGAGLRKPTRVRRSSSGRTAGERSVSRTYKSLPRPRAQRRADQGPNALLRGGTISELIVKQQMNARAKKGIAKALRELEVSNPNFLAKLREARPSYAVNSTTIPEKAAGIYSSRDNTIYLDPVQSIALSGAWGKKAQQAASQVLFHEQAHANQFQVDKTPKRDWQVEAQAEIKARKIAKRMFGKPAVLSYEDFVKKYLNRKLGR